MTKNRDAIAAGKLVAGALFAVLFCAGPVAAAPATATPAPAAKSAPPAMQTAPAQPATPDDPAKVAVARQFVLTYHPRMDPKFVSAQLDKFMPKFIEAAKKEDPKLDPKKYAAQRRAEVLDRVSKGLDIQSQVVSRHFTLAELKQLLAFYSSPLGRKLTAETPKIQRELMLLSPLRMARQKSLSGANGSKTLVSPPAKASASPAKGSSPQKK